MNASDSDPLVTRERASVLLDRNVRTVSRALGHIEPDDAGPPPKWRLSTVREALAARAERVNSGGNGYTHGSGAMERVLVELKFLSGKCQALLDALRAEPDVAKRLDVLKADGKVVGAFFAALDKSLALQDEDEREINRFYVDRKLKGEFLAELFHLVGIEQKEIDAWRDSLRAA